MKEILLEVSNRHVHLTKEVYDKLFDEELTVKKELSQTGEFASNQTLTIRTESGEMPNVRILGPLRKYNQVELSRKDAIKLKINPPVRKSGDVAGSEKITLVTPKGEVEVEGCILAQRHVHMNYEMASELGVKDDQLVRIKIPGERSGKIDAYVKLSENGVFVAHLDTDDAAAFLIDDNNNKGIMII